MERDEMLAAVRSAKATGDHPAAWFKGYTKLEDAALAELVARVALQEAPGGAEVTQDAPAPPDAPQDAPGGPRTPPEGIPTTPGGYPVRVQVTQAAVVAIMGRPNQRIRAGEIFRGERAWALWDDHPALVKAIP